MYVFEVIEVHSPTVGALLAPGEVFVETGGTEYLFTASCL